MLIVYTRNSYLPFSFYSVVIELLLFHTMKFYEFIFMLTFYRLTIVQMSLIEFNERIQAIQDSGAQCMIKMARV